MGKNKAMDVVFLDLAKAFEKVPHKRLKAQIRVHGIAVRVLKWIST